MMNDTTSNGLKLLNVYDSSTEDDESDSVSSISIDHDDDGDVHGDVDGQVQDCLEHILLQVVKKLDNERKNSFKVFRASRNDDEIDISSASSTSSSDWLSDGDIETDLLDVANQLTKEQIKKHQPKTKGELGLEDLPPIEKLTITIDSQELEHMGRIASIIDTLIVVQSFKDMPALDLDTILFKKDGSALGRVFDVFGPVIEPRYCVRFNTEEEIKENNIIVDMPVYFAHTRPSPITSYVFLSHLRKIKGSDASTIFDNEAPEEEKEFSDDDEERSFKMKQRAKKRRPDNSYYQASPMIPRVPPNTPTTPYQNHFQVNNFNHLSSNVGDIYNQRQNSSSFYN